MSGVTGLGRVMTAMVRVAANTARQRATVPVQRVTNSNTMPATNNPTGSTNGIGSSGAGNQPKQEGLAAKALKAFQSKPQ